MSLPQSAPNDAARQALVHLHDSLLVLHKALIDSERITYEKTFGTVESANRFLQLLIDDPWFAWLHPISELVVEIDELLDDATKVNARNVNELYRRAQGLLKASEEGEGFPRSYFEALQREPEVVLAHADVMRHLKKA